MTGMETNRMIDPYAHIDWQTVTRVPSANHMHMTDQKSLDNGYRYGIRHFPISNYYPSAPYDQNPRLSDFRLHQHWRARRIDGTSVEPPINWNDIITWRDELNEPYRLHLPFSESGRAFHDIPEDAILSPNAEHHGFSNSKSHLCCPGSELISGNIDPQGDKYDVKKHGFCVGFGGSWQDGVEAMLTRLKYSDAGGVTVSHPTWFSQFTDAEVYEMLDFDTRVLGIEIYNDYSAGRDWFGMNNPGYRAPKETELGFSLNMWNRILSTGRRCWGYCVPDHSVEKGIDWRGRNILLVSEFTEHACLEAYRRGNFYGCLKDNGLSITDFAATDRSIFVRTNKTAAITFITDSGRVQSTDGDNAVYKMTSDGEPSAPVFVRVEVEDETGERLFMQPVIYFERETS
jgi:hypothetical protein